MLRGNPNTAGTESCSIRTLADNFSLSHLIVVNLHWSAPCLSRVFSPSLLQRHSKSWLSTEVSCLLGFSRAIAKDTKIEFGMANTRACVCVQRAICFVPVFALIRFSDNGRVSHAFIVHQTETQRHTQWPHNRASLSEDPYRGIIIERYIITIYVFIVNLHMQLRPVCCGRRCS